MVGIKMYRHWLWMRGRTDVVQCRDFVSTVVIFSCCTMGNVSNCRDTAVQEISWNPFTGLPFGRSAIWLKEKGGIERKKRKDQNNFYGYNFSGVHDVLSTMSFSFALSCLSFFSLPSLHSRDRRTLAGWTYLYLCYFTYFACTSLPPCAWHDCSFILHEFDCFIADLL